MKVTIISHRREVESSLEKAADRALMICGGMAESYARQNLTENKSVDTGLLRNSVTFARAGQAANNPSYSADKGGGSGHYEGTAPADKGKDMSVYIGTNVEYAPFVELGTIHSRAKPYLRPAVENHMREYQEVVKNELKKG